MASRIGLTMRVVDAVNYVESRDALAQDWPAFMAAALPEVNWMPIPNLGSDAVPYAQDWGLDGLILTSGNDIGENAERDATERALLAWALQEAIPVFGVCRGLQMVQTFMGGSLHQAEPARHVATDHAVRIAQDAERLGPMSALRTVNSFHTQAVAVADLAEPLRAFAVTDDGLAEGVYHPDASLVAVQWHPERRHPFDEQDRQLMRRTLGIEG